MNVESLILNLGRLTLHGDIPWQRPDPDTAITHMGSTTLILEEIAPKTFTLCLVSKGRSCTLDNLPTELGPLQKAILAAKAPAMAVPEGMTELLPTGGPLTHLYATCRALMRAPR